MATHESKIYKGLKTKIILPVCSEKKTAAMIFCRRWVLRDFTQSGKAVNEYYPPFLDVKIDSSEHGVTSIYHCN